ncbi:MAG: transposase family protein [Pseudanabaenaceae cyanobacterium bins.39]|nr:transposase family protein [Pseudanabaenaceae cyanobacterium bins.39]
MNQTIAVSLLKHFEGVEDPQDNRGKEHNLLDIIVIAICAVISGGENWEDIALFGESKQEWLWTAGDHFRKGILTFLRLSILDIAVFSTFLLIFWLV